MHQFPNKCPEWAGPTLNGLSESKGGCTRIVSPMYTNLESMGCFGAHEIPFDNNIYYYYDSLDSVDKEVLYHFTAYNKAKLVEYYHPKLYAEDGWGNIPQGTTGFVHYML